MLALWASCQHHRLFILITLLTFYIEIGALWCIYALFRSFMNHVLIDSLSSLFFYCPNIIFHHTSLFISFVPFFCLCYHFFFFYVMSDDFSYFSAWRTITSFSTPISWTLVQRSLVEKVILSERVCICYCLRVYPFHYVFSMEFICWYSEYAPKKKGNKCMYIVSFSIECIYWSLRLLYWVSCLWKFICELSGGSHLFVPILLCILCVREGWHFP